LKSTTPAGLSDPNGKEGDASMINASTRDVIAVLTVVAGVLAAGCGDDAPVDVPKAAATTTASTTADTSPASLPTSSPATTDVAATSTPPSTSDATMSPPGPATSIRVDDGWRRTAAALCAAYVAALPPPEQAVDDVVAYVAALRDIRNRLGTVDSTSLPRHLRAHPTDVPAVGRRADEVLAEAEAAATAGDTDTALGSIRHYRALLAHIGALLTLAGVACGGDPARAHNATLNVPIPGVGQVATGFGSVWGTSPYGTDVYRVDPASGAVLAVIDVGSTPFKLQPADGRMIVRTSDSYLAIDPTTNTVMGRLAMSDVGPAAGRSWAVDGGLWICDGQRLHRYRPATFQPTGATIELHIACGQVYATNELVVAWTYNEDAGESGSSAAVFIDPATNHVLATTDLPVDVGVPIVLDDAVYLPAHLGNRNVVVDRATWTVTATPDYRRQIGGSQMASDGRSIYLIADSIDVLVIDGHTYIQRDVIEPLSTGNVNALAFGADALWVATGGTGILERFDIPNGSVPPPG
jgi:hypothetical protein